MVFGLVALIREIVLCLADTCCVVCVCGCVCVCVCVCVLCVCV